MASSTTTTREIGTRSSNAASPPAAMSTRRISSVAYAVEEMASDAKTAKAMTLIRRWWCSSEEAMGGPIRIRLRVEYIPDPHATHGSPPASALVDVDGHRRDHGMGPEQEAGLEGQGRLVVEHLRVPGGHHELGDDDGDEVVGVLGVEVVEEGQHRSGQLPVRGVHGVQLDGDVPLVPGVG